MAWVKLKVGLGPVATVYTVPGIWHAQALLAAQVGKVQAGGVTVGA